MTQPQQLEINDRVSIPLSELSFRASRSGGPGGQHVNTSSTRIELWWDLAASPSLDDESRARVASRLATRLVDDGRLLRLVSSGSRSQAQNRAEVIERFRTVLAGALRGGQATQADPSDQGLEGTTPGTANGNGEKPSASAGRPVTMSSGPPHHEHRRGQSDGTGSGGDLAGR